jgi:diguanylate cyclase (GGDEF)-like protein/PAS domain S-box-containing protein
MSVAAKAPIRVLCVEDVAADAELELRELKRAGLRVVHKIADTEERFVAELREFVPEIILSDFSMPSFDGMAALALARELAPETPFIFVSGTIGEEYAIRALKNGATDYVLKTNLVRLPAAVERALADARERLEKRRAQADLDVARQRLTSIFASILDVLWSVDAQTREVIYISPTVEEVFGHSQQQYLLDHDLWNKQIHAEDRDAVAAAWQRAQQGQPFDIDYRIAKPQGTERWINARGRLVRSADGSPERIDGLARDVTEQIEQRNRLARLSRIRGLAGAVNAAIVRIRDRQALFEEFCRIAVEQGGFSAARLVDFDADGRLRLAVSDGGHAGLLASIIDGYNRDPAGRKGLLAQALRDAVPVVANDVSVDERSVLRQVYAVSGINSVACLPFLVDGKVAGAVVLDASERRFFDEQEIHLLTELASNLSFALELMAKQDRITYLALYDALTELPNRTLFYERLTRSIERAAASDARVALVLLDLERFKAINDTLGEHIGDRVLVAVAKRIREWSGDPEHVARLGGNLFALILGGFQGKEDIVRTLEAAASALFSNPFDLDGREVRLAAKSAIAISPDHGRSADVLFRNAEAALRQAKETRERSLFYTADINARVSEQVDLENRLRKAVDNGELFLHFQPKLDLASREIVGLEALMRWQGPEGGLVSPAKFVPILEQTGLILEAGQQVLRSARAAHRDWQARGLNPPRIAVNVSALQLLRRDFVEDVRNALGSIGADGGGVDLEVTESLLMTAVDESIRKLRELREMGLRIALDDFGTGFSSLSYLTRLPLDTLKIDRSFIHGMTDNPDHTSIISAIISLAQALRLKVVAEGVETEPQAQLLRLLRCDQAQGFLFSRPLPAEQLEKLLKPL